MGWGGAWRQEELKRFSSWVTTKVGLSQGTVGPQPGGLRSRCNSGFCQEGAAFPPAFPTIPQALLRVQIRESLLDLLSTWLHFDRIKGLEQTWPPPLWGLHSKLENPSDRGLIRDS